MLLQNMMIYGINDNAIKVNPFILPYIGLQYIKFENQFTKIFK